MTLWKIAVVIVLVGGGGLLVGCGRNDGNRVYEIIITGDNNGMAFQALIGGYVIRGDKLVKESRAVQGRTPARYWFTGVVAVVAAQKLEHNVLFLEVKILLDGEEVANGWTFSPYGWAEAYHGDVDPHFWKYGGR